MKFNFLALVIALLSLSTFANGQTVHLSDVQFGYDDLASPSSFVIIGSDQITDSGILYYFTNFVEPDPFVPGDFGTDDPGFTTNPTANLQINDGDRIYANVLDASEYSSVGVGYVNYYGLGDSQLSASGRLKFIDRSASTVDLVLDGDSISNEPGQSPGETPQFISTGVDGNPDTAGADLHRHIAIDLLDDATAPAGAYGVMLELQSDFDPSDDVVDLTSEPFWFIWNHMLSDSDFLNSALPAFIDDTVSQILGDFNLDGVVDSDDLDEYIGHVGAAAEGDLAALDLDGNGTVDPSDFATLYEDLVETSNGRIGTFAGDLNLDGKVDVLGDAAALVDNLGLTVTSWGQGDIDGNGIVDVLNDAAALVNNLGKNNGGSAATASAVPEPSGASILACLTGALSSRRRRR